jgi:hypothetical protein
MNIKYFLSAILCGMLIMGCYKPHDEVVPQGSASGSVVVSKINSGFFNLSDLANAFVSFELSESPNSKNVSSVDVSASLNSTASADYKPITTLNTLPGTVVVTAAQAATAFGVDISSFKLGDVVRFRFKSNFADGTSSSSAATVIAPYSCPSDLAGTYTAYSDATSTDGCATCGELMQFQATVTITRISDGVYRLSDFSAGAYLEWYAGYGISPATNLTSTIRDVCNVISFDPFNEPFGTAVVASGSYNPTTRELTYTWKNGYDDEGTVRLVKQ